MRYSVVRIFPVEDLGAMQAREKVDAKLDKISVLISGVCLFHCASFPVVLLVGSSVSALAFFSSHLLHQILLFLALPLSYFALLGGYRTHGNRSSGVLAIIGISFLGLGVYFHGYVFVELSLTTIGSVLLASAHLYSLYLKSKFLSA